MGKIRTSSSGQNKNKGQERKAKQIRLHGKQSKERRVGKAKLKKTKVLPWTANLAVKEHKADRTSASSAAPAASSSSAVGFKYDASQRILLLGEADFSFAASLAMTMGEAGRLAATTLDDERITRAKGYAEFEDNAEVVRSFGGVVAFGVDAAEPLRSDAVKRAARPAGKHETFGFDRIVFNFPDCGASGHAAIAENQALLRRLFTAVSRDGLLAPSGQLHLTLSRGEPSDKWDAVEIARIAGLRVGSCAGFDGAQFPGYAYCAAGGGAGGGGPAVGKTYAFVPAQSADEPKKKSAAPAPAAGSSAIKALGGGASYKIKALGIKGPGPARLGPTGQTYKDAWAQRHRKS